MATTVETKTRLAPKVSLIPGSTRISASVPICAVVASPISTSSGSTG